MRWTCAGCERDPVKVGHAPGCHLDFGRKERTMATKERGGKSMSECAVCSNPGAVPTTMLIGNVLIASRPYCGAKCLLEDWEVFTYNAKKGAQCARDSLPLHAIGECPCGLL
jgi:hypothetical protein